MLTEVGGGEAEFDLEGLGHRHAGLGSGDDGPDAVFPAELHEGLEVVDGGVVDGEVRHGGAVGQAAVEGAAGAHAVVRQATVTQQTVIVAS